MKASLDMAALTVESDRRAFLKTAGGLVLGLSLPTGARHAAAATSAPPAFAPNAFIRIDRQGAVTLVMPMAEMGQGIYTALAMLLAEELEVGMDQVRLEHAPADDALYANAILHVQTAGLSASVRGFWTPLRQAGAAARTLLVDAAADEWGVLPEACRAGRGVVTHTASKRSLRYGALVDAAAVRPMPPADRIKLKEPKDFKLIGTSAKRVEGPAKVNGRAIFGIDVQVPGMKYATLAISPAFGGSVKSFDEAAVRRVKGVHQVVQLREVVAVIADHTGAARKGLAAAAIEWDDGPHGGTTTETVIRQLEEGSQRSGAVARREGDVVKALAGAVKRLDAVYQLPFLAHAAMEPMNCTVHVRKDACDVWVGTQAPTLTQSMVAEATGLPKSAVAIHNQLLGGGFGRRLDADGTVIAVRIAMKVDGPVKVIWSREEDIQHDMYRPYYLDRLSAGLDANGMPVAWTHRVCGSSVVARYIPGLFKDGLDFDAVEGAARLPYDFANMLVDYVRVEPPGIQTAFWRGVGATHNGFVVESFIDELAAVAGRDPVDYRRSLLTRSPRALGVLNLAAAKAGWGTPLPPGWGRGVSVQSAFGSFVSQVVEVEAKADGSLRVHRIVCAVDCGLAINPNTIAAQVEGGSLFGLTALLRGEITLKNGRVEQGNFNDYQPLWIHEAPVVETHLVASGEAPGGIGEAPTAALGGAVANAVFAATGHRVRRLPIERALARARADEGPRAA
jgi:isoquinoline 1-oxidoreductase beta subunit